MNPEDQEETSETWVSHVSVETLQLDGLYAHGCDPARNVVVDLL